MAQVEIGGGIPCPGEQIIDPFHAEADDEALRAIVSDRLRSYGAEMKATVNVGAQDFGRWLNNWAENSHQPFRRREQAMVTFRNMKTRQKFASDPQPLQAEPLRCHGRVAAVCSLTAGASRPSNIGSLSHDSDLTA